MRTTPALTAASASRPSLSHAVLALPLLILILREVERRPALRQVIHESIGLELAFRLRLRQRAQEARPRPGDKWHLYEVFIRIRIRGKVHYLWRSATARHLLGVLSRSRAAPRRPALLKTSKGSVVPVSS